MFLLLWKFSLTACSLVARGNRRGVRWEINQRCSHSGQEPFMSKAATDSVYMFFASSYIFDFHLKIALCKWRVLSIRLPPPTRYDCCVPPPPNPSASVHGALGTVPVESPVSVHYLISGGIDCGDSLIHIHIQYKHNWSSAGHWGGWRRRKIYTSVTDHRPSCGIRTVCAGRNKTLFW